MNERMNLLKKIQAYCFAAYDWNLYLDTHPDDKDAIKMFHKMVDKADGLKAEYQSKYGPLTAQESKSMEHWDWLDDPWPWEKC